MRLQHWLNLSKEANDRAEQRIKLGLLLEAQRYIIITEYCLLRYEKAKAIMLKKREDIFLNRIGNICSWAFVALLIYLIYKKVNG